MVMFVGNIWTIDKIDLLIGYGIPLVVVIGTMIMFILDFATKGKYRTRPVALIILVIGLILGLIYVLAGASAQ
jgi:hypothetical protein